MSFKTQLRFSLYSCIPDIKKCLKKSLKHISRRVAQIFWEYLLVGTHKINIFRKRGRVSFRGFCSNIANLYYYLIHFCRFPPVYCLNTLHSVFRYKGQVMVIWILNKFSIFYMMTGTKDNALRKLLYIRRYLSSGVKIFVELVASFACLLWLTLSNLVRPLRMEGRLKLLSVWLSFRQKFILITAH